MPTLKAKSTLALERGRAEVGEVFHLHSEQASKDLVEAGHAELVTEGAPANPRRLDAKDLGPGKDIKLKTDKSAEERKTKPEAGPEKTKEE